MSSEHIFISHATPEDNHFTRWLGAKLTLHGYQVWHDLDRLKGGDIFWPKIEKAIRENSFRMLAVVSQISIIKEGVQNEWAVGLTMEREQPGFVIPLRIDSLDFSKLPITMHRKNVIDFDGGWHKGLSNLLDTLSDARAPRVNTVDPAAARQWLADSKPGAIAMAATPETLESNWIPILSLPPTLETARILSSARKISVTAANRRLPWFEYGDRIASFAKADEIVKLLKDDVPLKNIGAAVDTKTFVSEGGGWGEYKVSARDARFRVENLVRQAWELEMERLGLKAFALSGGRPIHYVPKDFAEGGKVSFVDADGKSRKRGLTGRSEVKKANWHYGIGIRPSVEDLWRLELKATIVFTDDNGQPFDSARSHRLRMSFCRGWWNDRWRGFLRAFLSLASGAGEKIILSVGEGRVIEIGAQPMEFLSPVSLTDGAMPIEELPILDVVDDVTDWDDLEEGEEAE